MSVITGFSDTHVFVDTEDGRVRKFLLKRLNYDDPHIGDRVQFYCFSGSKDWFIDLEKGWVRPEKTTDKTFGEEDYLNQARHASDNNDDDGTFDFTNFFSRSDLELEESRTRAYNFRLEKKKEEEKKQEELENTTIGKLKRLIED